MAPSILWIFARLADSGASPAYAASLGTKEKNPQKENIKTTMGAGGAKLSREISTKVLKTIL